MSRSYNVPTRTIKLKAYALQWTELYLKAHLCGESHPKDPEHYDVEAFLWEPWSLLILIVRMIPYNHPKQCIERGRNCYYMGGTCSSFHTRSYIPIFKFYGMANSDFILVEKANMGRPPYTKTVFERWLVWYV